MAQLSAWTASTLQYTLSPPLSPPPSYSPPDLTSLLHLFPRFPPPSSYLDFGLLVRMDRKHQAAMLAAIAHLVNGEWQYLADDLASLDVLKPTTDRQALAMVSVRDGCGIER